MSCNQDHSTLIAPLSLQWGHRSNVAFWDTSLKTKSKKSINTMGFNVRPCHNTYTWTVPSSERVHAPTQAPARLQHIAPTYAPSHHCYLRFQLVMPGILYLTNVYVEFMYLTSGTLTLLSWNTMFTNTSRGLCLRVLSPSQGMKP